MAGGLAAAGLELADRALDELAQGEQFFELPLGAGQQRFESQAQTAGALKTFRGEAIRGWWSPSTGEAGRLRQARRQPRCPGFGQGRRPTGRERLFHCLNRRYKTAIHTVGAHVRQERRRGGLGLSENGRNACIAVRRVGMRVRERSTAMGGPESSGAGITPGK